MALKQHSGPITVKDPRRNRREAKVYDVPAGPWPAELEQALGDYARLEADRVGTYRDRAAAAIARDQAKDADREQRAQSLLDGKAAKAGGAETKAQAELERLERHYDDVVVAAGLAYDRLVSLLEARQADWAQECLQARLEAQRAYARAVEAMVSAQAEFLAEDLRHRFLAGWPDGRWKTRTGVELPSKAVDDGGVLRLEALATSLRRHAGSAPPEPKTYGERVRAAGRVPGPLVQDPGEFVSVLAGEPEEAA